jgi:DNA-binding transcriptional LysR family regulator
LLDGIDVFVAVVDAGGFSAAADRLGKSKSHVSKTVTRLENRLAVRLLNRTTRSVRLTETGRLYYDSCSRIVGDAEEAMRLVTDREAQPQGTLRLSAPVSFGLGYLSGALPKFVDENPMVVLDIDLNDSMVDVIAGDFDVVLRVGELEDSNLIARRFNTSSGVTVASPDYWKLHGKPRHPSELKSHRCIGYSRMQRPGHWRYFDGKGDPVFVEVELAAKCNSAELETSMAVNGLGVTRLPEFACARELSLGLLEPALEDFCGPAIWLYAVYPHRRHLSAKVRAFVDFLVREFGGAEM